MSLRSSLFTHTRRTALVAGCLAVAGIGAAVYGAQKTGSGLDLRQDDSPIARNQFDQASYADVVAKVAPSVVKITVETKARPVAGGAFPGFDDPMFRQFFGGQMPQMQQPPQEGLGSGVIISPDGYIVTNNHVVDGADSVKVALSDGREFPAKVVGRDPLTDVAVVKIDAHGLPAITFADSAKIRVGDRVLAVGNPFGLDGTVTSGIISAKGRQVGILQDVKGFEDFLQTDAAINPGNSGGALVDIEGRLVGLNTAILSHSGGFQGIGLAVPSAIVSQVAESLVRTGHVVRGYLGMMIQPITPDLEASFNLKDTQGALVAGVEPGSPAAKSGIKEGDVITSIDGKPVTDATGLALSVSAVPPGTELHLDIVRNGEPVRIVATTTTRPGAGGSGDQAVASNGDQGILNGVAVDDLTPDARQEFNIPDRLKGALITKVDPNSAAAQAGISAGDVILEIDRHPVTSAQDAVDLSTKAQSKKTLLRLWSHGSTLFVVVDESQSGNSPS
jgi:serine protease Do